MGHRRAQGLVLTRFTLVYQIVNLSCVTVRGKVPQRAAYIKYMDSVHLEILCPQQLKTQENKASFKIALTMFSEIM